MNKIDNRLKKIIKTCCGFDINIDDIKEETNLIKDLGINSIKMMYLINALEKEFNITFLEEGLSIDNVSVYKTLLCYIEDLMYS